MLMNRKTQNCQDVNSSQLNLYTFNAIPIKTSASYFVNIDKLILKFMWRDNRPRLANTRLKNNKVGRLTLSDFKT